MRKNKIKINLVPSMSSDIRGHQESKYTALDRGWLGRGRGRGGGGRWGGGGGVHSTIVYLNVLSAIDRI